MTLEEYDTFCAELGQVSFVKQWGGAHVWKIGGKVFAIGWSEGDLAVTFKAGEIGYEVLKDEPGYRPAPYFASRGMKWIRADAPVSEAVYDRIRHSFELVFQGLSRKKQAELGLDI